MTIEVEGPDGVVVEFPDGTPPEVMQQAMVAHYAQRAPDAVSSNGAVSVWVGDDRAPPAPKPDQLQGFMKGVSSVVDNAAPLLAGLPGMMGGAGQMQTMAQMQQEAIRRAEAEGRPSGETGERWGKTAASLPFGFVGGPVTGGALEGFVSSDADNWQGRALDTAKGAAGGKVGAMALGGLAGAVRGVTDPMLQHLASRGVRTTPGQTFGGMTGWIEDRATGLPFVGPAIEAARGEALDTFNRGAVNEVLGPLGQALPKTVRTGHEAVAYADDLIGRRYDELTPSLNLKVDPRMLVGARKVADEMATMTDDGMSQVNRIMAHLLKFGDDYTLSGKAVRRAESELGAKASAYSRSPNASEKEVGHMARILQDEVKSGITRQHPEKAADLKAAHQSFKNLLPVEHAAGGSGAREGVFTPSQLKSASRATDRSARKRASAKGEAAMQGYAEAGQSVLKTLPDSGTMTRSSIANVPAWMLGAILRAGYEPSKLAAKVARLPRSERAKAIAAILQEARPFGAVAGATAASQHPE